MDSYMNQSQSNNPNSYSSTAQTPSTSSSATTSLQTMSAQQIQQYQVYDSYSYPKPVYTASNTLIYDTRPVNSNNLFNDIDLSIFDSAAGSNRNSNSSSPQSTINTPTTLATASNIFFSGANRTNKTDLEMPVDSTDKLNYQDQYYSSTYPAQFNSNAVMNSLNTPPVSSTQSATQNDVPAFYWSPSAADDDLLSISTSNNPISAADQSSMTLADTSNNAPTYYSNTSSVNNTYNTAAYDSSSEWSIGQQSFNMSQQQSTPSTTFYSNGNMTHQNTAITSHVYSDAYNKPSHVPNNNSHISKSDKNQTCRVCGKQGSKSLCSKCRKRSDRKNSQQSGLESGSTCSGNIKNCDNNNNCITTTQSSNEVKSEPTSSSTHFSPTSTDDRQLISSLINEIEMRKSLLNSSLDDDNDANDDDEENETSTHQRVCSILIGLTRSIASRLKDKLYQIDSKESLESHHDVIDENSLRIKTKSLRIAYLYLIEDKIELDETDQYDDNLIRVLRKTYSLSDVKSSSKRVKTTNEDYASAWSYQQYNQASNCYPSYNYYPNNNYQIYNGTTASTNSACYNNTATAVASSSVSPLKALHFLLLLFSSFLSLERYLKASPTLPLHHSTNHSVNNTTNDNRINASSCQKYLLKLIDSVCSDKMIKTKILLSISDFDLI